MSNSVPWGSPIRLLTAPDGLGADYGASRPARLGLLLGAWPVGRGRPLRAIIRSRDRLPDECGEPPLDEQ
jgi:hypothetical protein